LALAGKIKISNEQDGEQRNANDRVLFKFHV
jgi:hypothetical protein